MNTRSEYAADRAVRVAADSPAVDPRAISGRIWVARGLGLLFLLVALAVLAKTGGSFGISATVMVAFAGYVFFAELQARRATVALEKRLRLSLLVHNMELENMAMQDDLTQLFNRRYFFERLERELESARAFNRPLSLMVIDLDGMKQVNDNYGHRAGDQLLSTFGRFLLAMTRASDVPARTGGDEFAIILPDTPEAGALAVKQRLARNLQETELPAGDTPIRARASLGVATFPKSGTSVDTLVQAADVDMYADKNMRRAAEKAAARAS
ncbi:MAG TPA: GGDEF domain-containing protein [Dehalococcoidia bacterium]|nr:GGDEF domain-containing protein [Dehalococcoidia bacterium]